MISSRVAILNMEDTEDMMRILSKLTKEERDTLSHLLYVIGVEESYCPKIAKSFNEEFQEIYLSDVDEEGDIMRNILSEINGLTGRLDAGSVERLYYLKKWTNGKFKVEV